MKRPGIGLAMLVSLLALVQAEAADVCTPTIGELDRTNETQEIGSWCWVASAKVFTDLFHLTNNDPSYMQCQLYNIGTPDPTDCCTDPSSKAQCLQLGWPDFVFDNLNPKILYDTNGAAMPWDQVKSQICPNGYPGRPFIYVTQSISPTGLLTDIYHTNVIKGFIEDPPTGTKLLIVDDHSGVGAFHVGTQDFEYECEYVESCYAWFTRAGDYYNIRRAIPVVACPQEPVTPGGAQGCMSGTKCIFENRPNCSFANPDARCRTVNNNGVCACFCQ